MQCLTPWLVDQEVGGFAGVEGPLGRGFDGLAEGEGPLDRDLAVEEGGDLCNLCNSSLYGHSFVFVVLVVHTLFLDPFDFCLPGLLFHLIAFSDRLRPHCSEVPEESWYPVCCGESGCSVGSLYLN